MSPKPPTPQQYSTKNFEGADLRGQSFPGAWHYANFQCVITGVPPIWNRLQHLFTFVLAFLAGFITAYAGATFGFLFEDSSASNWLLGLAVGIIIIAFFGLTLRKGLTAALGSLSFITIFLVVITVALADQTTAGLAAISALAIGGAIAGSVGLATAITLSLSWFFPLFFYTLGLIIGSLFGLIEDSIYSQLPWLIVLSVPVFILGIYLGHRTRNGDSRYSIIQQLATNFSTWHSTSFRNSDLTAADFRHTTLRHIDFSNANLTRTHWRNTTFYQNNLHGTYLANPKIRRLVTKLDEENGNFDRLDLRGVNLDHANLQGTSFIGTDLSNASLKGVDLTNAKLAQTQLYGADLTGAILTGACIENWGISPETQLIDIQCDYIFLRLPTPENPDPYRKPDNRNETFETNDFTDFIAPIINTLKSYKQQVLASTSVETALTKTLDLYHREGIDSIAVAIALQELINLNPPAQIEILSIEGVEQKIRIRASITSFADSSALNTRYFERYGQLATQPSSNLQSLFETLATQHTQLRSLEVQIATAVDSSGFYIAVPSSAAASPRRPALERKRDRLYTAIEQQNQYLDTLEVELRAANDQLIGELSEAGRKRLQRQINTLEENLAVGETRLAELERQLNNISTDSPS